MRVHFIYRSKPLTCICTVEIAAVTVLPLGYSRATGSFSITHKGLAKGKRGKWEK